MAAFIALAAVAVSAQESDGVRGPVVGTVGYDFTLSQIPVSTPIRVMRAVEVENRFQGTIAWLIAAPFAPADAG